MSANMPAQLPPSSPCVYLFRDGKPVYLLPRHQIENRQAPEIAKMLTEAFDEFCAEIRTRQAMIELDAVEGRVLGCLIEKEITTPEYYPMTLNALINACNQKSNRDPVVSFEEEDVVEAIDRLRRETTGVDTDGWWQPRAEVWPSIPGTPESGSSRSRAAL